MENRTKWIVIAAVAIGVVLICCLALALLPVVLNLFDTGRDYHGPGMHRDWWDGTCPGCDGFSVGNVLLVLLVLGIPAGAIILAGLAIFWLIRSGRPGDGRRAEE